MCSFTVIKTFKFLAKNIFSFKVRPKTQGKINQLFANRLFIMYSLLTLSFIKEKMKIL